jgi:NADH dehydrogenase/NADH:ubiquinone oxidoreductase subunit G
LITLTIDGEQVNVAEGTTIIEAAKTINIDIPHLCYFKGLHPDGSCGICIVEIEESAVLPAPASARYRKG